MPPQWADADLVAVWALLEIEKRQDQPTNTNDSEPKTTMFTDLDSSHNEGMDVKPLINRQ